MILLKLCRNTIIRLLLALVIISSLIVPPAFSQETEDSQIFIAGFNAYQQKDYATSIEKMNEVLQKHPDTPLRDMALFWLSRSYFKVGNQHDAARYLSQFSKEYPDNPLKNTVEDELLAITARYEKGEKLPVGSPPAKQPDRLAAQKAKAEKDRIAAAKAAEAKQAAAAAETARLAALRQTDENAAAEKIELARSAAAKAEQERMAAVKVEETMVAAIAAAAESAHIAALKQADEKAAAEKKDKERAVAVKAEQERIVQETAIRENAEQQRIATIKEKEAKAAAAAAAAESARIATLRLAGEKAAAEKEEQERVAAVKAEQERVAQEAVAKESAELQRVAAIKEKEAQEAAIAAAAESARIAAIKQADERAAADRKEQERVAAVKAEQERIVQEAAGRENAELQRIAAIQEKDARVAAMAAAAEAARIAALKRADDKAAVEKQEQELAAAAKAEQERIVQEAATRENAERQRVAAIKEEEAKVAAIAAAEESARLAALKQASEKAAAEKKEQEREAAAKAEQERIIQEAAIRENAEQQRIAAIKEEEARVASAAVAAESARIAAVIEADERASEQERIATAKAEQERLAAIRNEEAKLAASAKAEQERLAAVQAEEELRVKAAAAEAVVVAAQKAERERVAAVKVEEAKAAAAAAEAARFASVKAEEERIAAERAVKEAENSRLSALKAEESRIAEQKRTDERAVNAKLAYREKAITQYKAIIEKFPASAAAVTAAAKLRELGIIVALPAQPVEAPLPENAQVLRLEVAQFAGFELNLMPRPDAFTVGRPIVVPFEVINRGNGNDSFHLDSAFPAEFHARFSSAAAPGVAISQTAELTPGETFKGIITLTIPPGSIDGLRITHPVKAASHLMTEASQSREIVLVASAPLLRAVLRTENSKPLPGDTVVYRIAILNVGSTSAQDVTFRLNYPPQLEPVDFAAAGFRQEMKSTLVFDGLQVNSGESREFSVAFQLKSDSLAGQELLTRADLINNPLKTTASFVSNMASVEAQRGILVRTGSERQIAIPGQTITVPFIVTNSGNVREKFKITSVVAGAQNAVIFNDLNRDGIRQGSEPIITEIGPLAPREEASVVVEIKTPISAVDNSQGSVQISFTSEGDASRSASGATQLTYSRPVLKMAMTGRDGRLKPGDVASFDLTITNNGSNLARVVELQSAWPEQLELVAADPVTSVVSNGAIIWRFKELGSGEKRNIKVSFRVKPGTGVGTAVQVKNILSYEDQLGNRY